MNNWAEGIQRAISHIENHITDDLDISAIAAQAYSSAFHFQRIFSVLCGMTVGEYIRSRRLSLAAQELTSTDEKVIDVALKYGYDSPDSFARAFQKFHGITPSQARQPGAHLKAFAPMRIKLTMEGGTMMDYRIEEKHPFTVVGVTRSFNSETSYSEIPKFWDEYLARGANRSVCGMYGLCLDSDGKDFEYMIADNYLPCKPVPEDCAVRAIPGGTWAIFPCTLATLQDTNTRMWSEWVPSASGYRLNGNYNIEFYTPPAENPMDSYCELWLPVEKI